MIRKIDWEHIIFEICEEKDIIPVVGPELLQIKIKGETRDFRQWLAINLAKELELSTEGLHQSLHPIEEVMLRHYNLSDPNSLYPYQKIKSLIFKEEWEIPKALLQLTSIKDFRFFLTTQWEPFLERALKKSWNLADHEIRILENDLTKKPEDLDKFTRRSSGIQFDSNYIDNLYKNTAPPSVYYLYGKPSRLKSYALSEDDVLTANLMLQRPDHRPDELLDYLSNKRLLILGCNFPNWLARFFISLTSNDPRNPSKQPVFVMSDKSCTIDTNLTGFLKRQEAFVVNDGSLENFINDLYSNWTNNQTANCQTTKELDFESDSVFISYASEDNEQAEIIEDEIKSMGIPVWMDKKKLKAGDDWAFSIKTNITQSSIFVPVISKHSASGNPDRYFVKEWNMAIEILRNSGKKFKILPIALEQGFYDHPHIPSEFRSLHWLTFLNGSLIDQSLEELKNVYFQLKKGD